MGAVTCPACGRDHPADTATCAHCGAALPRPCRRCGRTNTTDGNFCSHCGAPLRDAVAARRPAAQPRSYTPNHLAQKILTSRGALEGERKQVTVFFADVKESMQLAERVDPETWHRIIDRFFAILADGIHRFEGTINQFTGDGVMALFGAPLAYEDHAQRACHAAILLREQVRRYGREIKRSLGLTFAVRMGINSGEVIVGAIGDDLRMDYTAQGHTVGLAARMQQIAEVGEVYLTADTAGLVSSFFEVRPVGKVRVKGVRGPVRTFVLVDAQPVRTRLEAVRARGFSRLVGRADEVAVLEGALSRAVSGYGQVVGVVGDPGVGKSRLCQEAVDRWRTQGVVIAEAHCPAHGKALPYVALADLLRSFFGIGPDDRPTVSRRRIRLRLRSLRPALTEDLPLVLDLLNLSDPKRPLPPLDAGARRERLCVFLRRLVQTQSASEPSVLLIDDAHWLDAESDTVLADLVDAVGWTRTLLLLNFRPDYSAAWMGLPYYQPLHVSPLDPAASDALLHELVGEEPALAAVCAAIKARAEGNPFFIEEIVQSLIDQGVLRRERAARHAGAAVENVRVCLARPVAEIRIPATVQSVLAARIDGLPEPAKEVLQTAAVIGKRFSEAVLQVTLAADSPSSGEPSDKAPAPRQPGTEAEVAQALRILQRAHLVRKESADADDAYAFKHALTQEVAYTSQLQETRARKHAAVARALEAAHADRLGEYAALLAHHWAAANEPYEAHLWRRRAALRVTAITLRRDRTRRS
jgi:class 3 adenylate cyclase